MENIHNFCIISHIDHGKSTLADRFLELTQTVPKEKMRPQFLDMMPLEREKGITIKMTPVRMQYILNLKSYILNLIDTPGHVDFSYEVSRSLAAVEGAILLVDATKGIQAQTIANLELARKQNLIIVPAINKIDSPQARIKETKEELAQLLNIPENEIFEISAKYGTNVEKLLEAVIKKIPSPKGDTQSSLRALIFDLKYDAFKGVVAFVRVFDGQIQKNEKILLMSNKIEGEAKEVGYFTPEMFPQKEIRAGEVGFIATGIKESGKVRVGDTVTEISNLKTQISKLEPLPGYQEPKPMVFASFYPQNPDDFDLLRDSLAKLKLNDPSLTFEPETKDGLGRGYRCGFLGTLHAEIISERVLREYKLKLIISTPSVLYKIIDNKDKELFIKSATDWPDFSQIKEIQEPWVKLDVIVPQNYLGRILELLQGFEASPVRNHARACAPEGPLGRAISNGARKIDLKYLSQNKILLIYEAPLRAIITGFYDKLKGASQGFSSMNYELSGYKAADLVKLEILIAGKKEEAFSKIVSRKDAYEAGKKTVEKLKEILPSQLFSVPLQAAISGKIVARETIRAKGKDVIAPLYGGDYTRKRKLLERQKKGKKDLKEKGRIVIPPNVFFEIFRS